MCKTVLSRGRPEQPPLSWIKAGRREGEGFFADHYSFIRPASFFLCPFTQLLLAREKSKSPVISGINHARAQGEPSRSLSFTQLKSSEPAVCGWLSSRVCNSSFSYFFFPFWARLLPSPALYCLLGDALCGFCAKKPFAECAFLASLAYRHRDITTLNGLSYFLLPLPFPLPSFPNKVPLTVGHLLTSFCSPFSSILTDIFCYPGTSCLTSDCIL